MSKVAEVRVPGALAPFASSFREALPAAGYTPLSAVNQLRLMAHLSRWLDARGLSAVDLTEELVEQYLAQRRAAGYTGLIGRRAMEPILNILKEAGVLPTAEHAAPAAGAPALLAAFERYLRAERGLAASTTTAYVARAARFLAGYTAHGEVCRLTSADVTSAVLAECTTRSVGAGQYFVAALRAFLRFAHVEGLVAGDLSAAALAVTGRRGSLLPKGIGPAEAEALLNTCDRSTAIGRRDRAVLLVLLRLGLRGGEVARLRLEDIDWRSGQLLVRGKGRRDARLPLPYDVGEAVCDYLRQGRPASARREVFVTAIAPAAGLTREAVSGIVRRACGRAGITQVGPHRLRHGLACAMVRAEVPLAEIGQVLRHRSPVSTAIYAVTRQRRAPSPPPGTTVAARAPTRPRRPGPGPRPAPTVAGPRPCRRTAEAAGHPADRRLADQFVCPPRWLARRHLPGVVGDRLDRQRPRPEGTSPRGLPGQLGAAAIGGELRATALASGEVLSRLCAARSVLVLKSAGGRKSSGRAPPSLFITDRVQALRRVR
jgi:site-specific recombinase XerD